MVHVIVLQHTDGVIERLYPSFSNKGDRLTEDFAESDEDTVTIQSNDENNVIFDRTPAQVQHTYGSEKVVIMTAIITSICRY